MPFRRAPSVSVRMSTLFPSVEFVHLSLRPSFFSHRAESAAVVPLLEEKLDGALPTQQVAHAAADADVVEVHHRLRGAAAIKPWSIGSWAASGAHLAHSPNHSTQPREYIILGQAFRVSQCNFMKVELFDLWSI